MNSLTTRGLAPALQPQDVVILDTLASHKVSRVREAIEAVGARLLHLPPYSPDFNPIENLWSKVKQILRGLSPRTAVELLHAVAIATLRHDAKRKNLPTVEYQSLMREADKPPINMGRQRA
jgi:transposase